MICACERSKDLVSNVGPFIAGGAEVGQLWSRTLIDLNDGAEH